MNDNFSIETTATPEGTITQEVYNTCNYLRELVVRRVMYTQDDQIRAALLALGWTPPPEKQPDTSKG